MISSFSCDCCNGQSTPAPPCHNINNVFILLVYDYDTNANVLSLLHLAGWILGKASQIYYGIPSTSLIPPLLAWKCYKGAKPAPAISYRKNSKDADVKLSVTVICGAELANGVYKPTGKKHNKEMDTEFTISYLFCTVRIV